MAVRYSRRRKRLKVFAYLFFLLFVTAIAYLEINRDSLLTSYKKFFEDRISAASNLKVSIESLEGGVFRGINLKGIVFSKEAGKRYAQVLRIERVRISCRLWDILLYRLFKDREIKFVVSRGEVFLPGEERPSVHGLRGSVLINKDSFQLLSLKATVRNLPLEIRGGITWHEKSPRMDFYSEFENRWTRGLIKVYGLLKEPHIGGYIIVFDKPYDFSGDILTYENGFRIKDLHLKDEYLINGEMDTRHNKYSLKIVPRKGEISIAADFRERDFLISGKIDHIDVGNFDVLTEVELTGERIDIGPDDIAFEGRLITSNTIINYAPFREFNGRYKLSRDLFTLASLKFGEEYNLSGKISLVSPYRSNISFEADNATVSDLVIFVSERRSDEEVLSGEMKGSIKLSGPIKNMKGMGHLEATKGHIGSRKYESANLNTDIMWPIATVRDSRIYTAEGYLILEGEIDLRRLGKAGALEKLNVRSDDRANVLSGWDTTKKDEPLGFSLGKNVGEDIHINFKEFVNNDLLINPDRDKRQQEVELEFKVNGKESLKMRFKEQEETFSLERKYKF